MEQILLWSGMQKNKQNNSTQNFRKTLPPVTFFLSRSWRTGDTKLNTKNAGLVFF